MKTKLKKRWIGLFAFVFLAISLQVTAAGATQGDFAKAAYKAELAKSRITFDGVANVPTNILEFFMGDINNDKVPELFVYSGQPGGLEQYKAYMKNNEIWSYVNGRIVKQRGMDMGIDGPMAITLEKYYPSKGIYYMSGGFKMMGWSHYYRLSGGKSTLLLKRYENKGYPNDSNAIVEYYNGNGTKISKAYFDNLLKSYVGGASVVNVPYSAFYKNTAANRSKVFGSAVPASAPEYQQTNSAVNLSNGILVSWKQSSNATGYIIYRKRWSNGTWQKIKTISGRSTTSYLDTSVAAAKHNGIVYYYAVCGVKGNVQGDYNRNGKFAYRLRSPGITGIANSAAGKVSLSWDRNGYATGYEVRYANNSSMTGFKTKTLTKNSLNSTVIGSLPKGQTWYFYVRSYKTVNGVKYYSGQSKTRSVKITK